MNKFECRKCGSNKLGYQKFVKCITPVSFKENSHIEYEKSTFDEDDSLAVHYGYCCMDCGNLINFCGCWMETESELRGYLALDSKDRDEQQKQYEEIASAQHDEEEKREKEFNENCVLSSNNEEIDFDAIEEVKE